MQPGPFGRGVSTYNQNRGTVINTTRALEEEYQVRSSQLPQTIEAELAATRQEGPTDPVPPLESIVRELGVLNRLTERKAAESHSKTATANAFYGGDPFNRHINEFMLKATKIEKWPGPNGIAMQALNESLRAAIDARLLSQTLQSLQQRTVNLQHTFNVMQAAEQARLAAEQEAQRVAAEEARKAQEARAREEAAAKELAERDAQIKELLEAMEALNAARANRPFPVSGQAAAAGPVFTVAAASLATSTATTVAIQTSLRAAVSAVIAAVAASAGAVVGGFAALLLPSPLGNSDLYALSVPLTDLAPGDSHDLHAIAEANGEIALPVAIGSRTVGNTTEFFVAATNGTTVPAKVPVRLAAFDPGLNAYKSYNPDVPSIGMTWTPIVTPNDASTTLPADEQKIAVYDGATVTALEGRLDDFPELDLYSFGGFITVFPADSGMLPTFTMFRDRRNDPGVASGYGDEISGIWLAPASEANGAVIPRQIADKLRGRVFSSFRYFREALWKAVTDDPELVKQFTANNVNEMKNERAAFTRKRDRLGGRVKFELHHVNPVSKGGEVYDVDNIRITTPKRHAEIHKGEK
ncbi:S-type pyocin domain-containing protein [Pseudomonas sp. VI4.1]|uniref:S-type pyocin domain-containing protein n=1 Tax=Pseudomonas sp. VI4.1 TaxID=1941346 RepID=UPI0021141D40|nr:S-type pyocin domain-containing protein [Pseudomonas sp. VI4.1]